MGQVAIVKGDDVSVDSLQLAYIDNWQDTHDFKKGSPRLHENRAPLLGASPETMLLATQSCVFLLSTELMKSRGSTGNILPPIWNAIV